MLHENEKKVLDGIWEIRQDIVDMRREFHRNPEPSNEEVKTAESVAQELQKLGLAVRRPVGKSTGLTADLVIDDAYPLIAFRADMDALRVTEDSTGKQAYASQVPGCFHGCGHDGHTAALVGAARVLVRHRDLLRCNVRFIFQPAEEVPPGGAKYMVKDGCLEGVEAVYGGHLNSPLRVGTAKCLRDWTFGTGAMFKVTVRGKGTHAGYPHQGVDTTLALAHLAVNLQSVTARMMDPIKPKVVGVMQIHVGEQDVTTPEAGWLSGCCVAQDATEMERLQSMMRQTAKATCDMFGATWEMEIVPAYPALFNTPHHADFAREALRDILGEEGLVEMKGTLGGEDFSYYLQEKPGAFYFLGAMNPEKNIDWPHHHPRFDVDEDSLVYMAQTHVLLALRYPEFRQENK